MKNTVIGIFTNQEQAQNAIDGLTQAGYTTQDISVVTKDIRQGTTIANNTGATVADSSVSGAATGGALGGLTGLLVGVGAISVPGLGALLIGGPLAVALGATGAAAVAVQGAVTGALAGGLIGALVGVGLSPEVAKTYEEQIKSGAILIAIPTRGKSEDEVREILHAYGADQINVVHV